MNRINPIDSRLKAKKKWELKNKDKRSMYNDRSATKRYILTKASQEDLFQVENWLYEAKIKLKENDIGN